MPPEKIPETAAPSTALADAAPSTALAETSLNARQRAFVEQLLIDNNATQAAIRAGYSPATATQIASDQLAKPHVAAAVERARAERLSRVNMTADTVLHEMAALALARVEHFVIDDDGQVRLAEGAPQNAMAAVRSIKRKTTVKPNGDRVYDVELQLWDKPGSLKLMGKHANVAACFDKVEVTGKGGGPLEVVTEVRRVVVRPGEPAREGGE